jgi:hypothetical protein
MFESFIVNRSIVLIRHEPLGQAEHLLTRPGCASEHHCATRLSRGNVPRECAGSKNCSSCKLNGHFMALPGTVHNTTTVHRVTTHLAPLLIDDRTPRTHSYESCFGFFDDTTTMRPTERANTNAPLFRHLPPTRLHIVERGGSSTLDTPRQGQRRKTHKTTTRQQPPRSWVVLSLVDPTTLRVRVV